MKNNMLFKQDKPTTAKILGVCMFVVACIQLLYKSNISELVALFLLSTSILGYSVAYEIRSDFKNKKHFRLFGFSVLELKLNCIKPDYISVFSASFNGGTGWGPIAAMNAKNGSKSYVIRFFKGNQYFTVFKSNSLTEVEQKGEELASLLKINLVNKI